MTQPNSLSNTVNKYKTKGLLIDSNLLLLYFIGSYNIDLITSYKRTKKYTREDFYTLKDFTNSFNKLVTTPNILTEVSNLSTQLNEKRELLQGKNKLEFASTQTGSSFKEEEDIIRQQTGMNNKKPWESD